MNQSLEKGLHVEIDRVVELYDEIGNPTEILAKLILLSQLKIDNMKLKSYLDKDVYSLFAESKMEEERLKRISKVISSHSAETTSTYYKSATILFNDENGIIDIRNEGKRKKIKTEGSMKFGPISINITYEENVSLVRKTVHSCKKKEKEKATPADDTVEQSQKGIDDEAERNLLPSASTLYSPAKIIRFSINACRSFGAITLPLVNLVLHASNEVPSSDRVFVPPDFKFNLGLGFNASSPTSVQETFSSAALSEFYDNYNDNGSDNNDDDVSTNGYSSSSSSSSSIPHARHCDYCSVCIDKEGCLELCVDWLGLDPSDAFFQDHDNPLFLVLSLSLPFSADSPFEIHQIIQEYAENDNQNDDNGDDNDDNDDNVSDNDNDDDNVSDN